MKISTQILDEFLKEHPDLVQKDPEICGGKVILNGTRLPLEIVLDCFDTGVSINSVCEWYPAPTVTPPILKKIKMIWDEKQAALHH